MKKLIKKILVIAIMIIAFNQVIAGTYNKSICFGGSTSIGNTCTGGLNYIWNTTPTQYGIPITVAPTANTQYIVSVYNASVLISKDTFNIVVNPLPVGTITQNQTICAGQNSTLIASGGTCYLWNTGANTAAITVSPNITTNYSVIITNINGCAITLNTTVTVNSLLVFTSVGSNSPVCSGSTLNLNSNVNQPGCYYVWTGPNGFYSNLQNPVITNVTVANTGTYTVTATFNGSSTSANTNVVINQSANVNLYFQQQNICLNANPITLTGGSPVGGKYYGTGVFNGLFYPSTVGVGTYNIYYEYTNSCGCTLTASTLLAVNPLPTVLFNGIFPNPVSLNSGAFQLNTGIPFGGTYYGMGVVNGWFYPCIAGVGLHTINYTYTDFMSCTNIAIQTITVVNGGLGIDEENSSNKIRIYPNPITDYLNIEMDEYPDRVQIVNLTGAVLISEKLNSKNFEIDVSHLSKGMYFVKIISQNGTVESLKIMK